jgi:uncharacterized repeat protein (TIGR03833 family)
MLLIQFHRVIVPTNQKSEKHQTRSNKWRIHIVKEISPNQIKVGSIVRIVQKQDQRSGKLTEGVVAKILTKSNTHPHGIKVMLESNVVGRVKEIL